MIGIPCRIWLDWFLVLVRAYCNSTFEHRHEMGELQCVWCVFAGAGKTYTMLGTDGDPGIMARTLNDLFVSMEKTSEDMKYKVTMSYLEVCMVSS